MRNTLFPLVAAAALAAFLPLQAAAQAPEPQSAFCTGLVQSFDTEYDLVQRHIGVDDPHVSMAKQLRDRAMDMCASNPQIGIMEIQRANRLLSDVPVAGAG